MTALPAHFDDICAILDTYYPNPQVPLEFSNAFTMLVAVVLSAQCTDKRVNEVTPKLWEHGQSPQAIIDLGPSLSQIIRPCGLHHRKSQAILALAQTLVRDYQGQVPKERAQLEALPGVGRKTANVILSHVFHEPAFPVDTHILRLSKRWQWSTHTTPLGVERDLCALFPPEQWMKRHLQLILFGRNYCKANAHDPKLCPACRIL